MDSYDVRFWDTKKIADNASGGRYRVRWAVNGQEHCKSFKNKTLADGFLDDLKDAARDRRPFSPRTGLPAAETTDGETVTWYEHARSYAEAKWPNLAPVSRRSVAEALVTVTVALTAKEKGAPEPRVLRRALFAWAFNPATRETDPPREIALALGWAARASLPRQRAGRPGHGAARARRVRQDPDGQAGRRVDPAAQAVGVLQRPRLRRRTRPPALQPHRPHPVDRPRRRGDRRPAGRGQPRPGQQAPGRRPGTV